MLGVPKQRTFEIGRTQARIDHRTLAAQGIDRQPSIHWGTALTAMIRRGIESRVERRVAWQEQDAALQRLRTAKETGVLNRKLSDPNLGSCI